MHATAVGAPPCDRHAVAHQQRYRLEMRVGSAVSVDARAGVHDVEVRMAARAPQHRVGRADPAAMQRRAGQRLAAAAAAVPVGEQLVADPAGQHGRARDREPADFARREVGEVGHRDATRADCGRV